MAGFQLITYGRFWVFTEEEFEFVPCSELFAETVKNFNAQQHTKLSFTDIAIATVALKRSDGLVLTFDEEFRKLPAIRLAE